jgi:hypothetical protein
MSTRGSLRDMEYLMTLQEDARAALEKARRASRIYRDKEKAEQEQWFIDRSTGAMSGAEAQIAAWFQAILRHQSVPVITLVEHSNRKIPASANSGAGGADRRAIWTIRHRWEIDGRQFASVYTVSIPIPYLSNGSRVQYMNSVTMPTGFEVTLSVVVDISNPKAPIEIPVADLIDIAKALAEEDRRLSKVDASQRAALIAAARAPKGEVPQLAPTLRPTDFPPPTSSQRTKSSKLTNEPTHPIDVVSDGDRSVQYWGNREAALLSGSTDCVDGPAQIRDQPSEPIVEAPDPGSGTGKATYKGKRDKDLTRLDSEAHAIVRNWYRGNGFTYDSPELRIIDVSAPDAPRYHRMIYWTYNGHRYEAEHWPGNRSGSVRPEPPEKRVPHGEYPTSLGGSGDSEHEPQASLPPGVPDRGPFKPTGLVVPADQTAKDIVKQWLAKQGVSGEIADVFVCDTGASDSSGKFRLIYWQHADHDYAAKHWPGRGVFVSVKVVLASIGVRYFPANTPNDLVVARHTI